MTICPFCRHNPYHYVDNGIGMEAVAVTCCELGIELFARHPKESITITQDEFADIANKLTIANESAERREKAIDLAVQYGGTDGEHHKAWVIDQIVQIIAGNDYKRIVADARDGEDGPETYKWDCGIAP